MSSLLVRLCACPSPYDVSAQDHDEGERVEEASLCSILNKLKLTWIKLISNSNQVTGLEVLEIKRHWFHGPDVNLIKIGECPVLLRRLQVLSKSSHRRKTADRSTMTSYSRDPVIHRTKRHLRSSFLQYLLRFAVFYAVDMNTCHSYLIIVNSMMYLWSSFSSKLWRQWCYVH